MDTIKITIETNAQDTAQTFEQLSNAFNDTDNSAKDLRKQIKGLKDELYTLTPGTEEYSACLGELGTKMDQLSETQQQLRAATGGLDTVFQTTTQATASLAGGFTAASGVVALFGGNAESLQKTFVQLQAAMSIMNGLKGFSGFIKNSLKASISAKTFGDQQKLTNKEIQKGTLAEQQQSVATETLSLAELKAAMSTLTLRGAIQSLTAAIASNPIGAVLVAITAAITAITSFSNATEEARERTKKYNDTLRELKDTMYTYSSVQEQELDYFNKDIDAMKKLGASQESINKKTLEFSKTRKEQLSQEREYLLHLYEVNGQTKGLEEQCEKWAERIRELNVEIKGLNDTINDLSWTMPDFAASFDATFTALERQLSRQVAQGLITPKQKIEELKKAYENEIQRLKDAIDENNKKLEGEWVDTDNGPRFIKANLPYVDQKQLRELNRDMSSTIEKYQAIVNTYVQDIEDIDDNAAKLLRDRRNTALQNSQNELTSLLNELAKEWAKIEKKIQNDKKAREVLGEALGDEAMEARMMESYTSIIRNFDIFASELLQKAGNNNKLLKAQYDELANTITNYQENIEDLFKDNNVDYSNWPVPITMMAGNIRAMSTMFINANNIMLKQVEDGTATIDDYNAWLLKKTQEFNTNRDKMLEEGNQLIETTLASMNISDAEKERLRKQWTELFNFSATLIPPEQEAKITEKIAKIVENQVKAAENVYNAEKQRLQTKYLAESNTIFDVFWGAGEGQQYKATMQNLKDQWSEYEKMYNKESQALQNGMDHAVNNDEYQAYLEQKKQLDADYEQAHEEYLASLEDAEHTHLKNMFSNINATASAVASLGSALSDYYDEMANDERLSTEEQQKYALKSLQMKKFQAVANIASGIVAAISTAMEMGFPMGPIIGAIEAASVAVAGAAQIKSINKQIRELGGSSGSDEVTANVSGITDRVVFGEAQNADQQAQLNGQYSAGDQRVYVVESDINNAQRSTRTAVTNNSF